MATLSLLSRVIESQWLDAEIVSIMDRVHSGTGDEGWTVHADGSLRGTGSGSPVDRFERGDPLGVSLLSICRAPRWHEDVSGYSLPVLLEWDEETRMGLSSTVSHVSAG